MRDVTAALNAKLAVPFNHWICTLYPSAQDNIGFDSDKDKDFAPDSWFVVLKLGAPRKFEFRMPPASEPPFYSETLSPGTAVFVRAKTADGRSANSLVKHGVPPADSDDVGPSASIVVRTTLFIGSCSVSEAPDVWQWVRNIRERGSLGANSACMRSAQRRLAALILAISR